MSACVNGIMPNSICAWWPACIRTYINNCQIRTYICRRLYWVAYVCMYICTYVLIPELHTYGTAQLKLETHFWLLVSVYRFYSSPSSMIACYLHVTLLTHEWYVRRNWLLHESPYEPPYEFHRGNISTRLDSWNMRDFPIKSYLVHGHKH